MAKLTKTEEKQIVAFDKTTKFTGKKLGANFIATYGTERYSRKVSMDEGEQLYSMIEKFNKRPSETAKKKIIDLLTPEALKKKQEVERKEMQAKGLNKMAKKAEKEAVVEKKEEKSFIDQLDTYLSEEPDAVDKLLAVINKHKKVDEKKPAPVVSAYRRSGEH